MGLWVLIGDLDLSFDFLRLLCILCRVPCTLLILPHHSDHLPLDLEIALLNEDGRHAGVGGTEFHTVIPLDNIF